MSDVVSIRDFADMQKISQSTVRRLIDAGLPIESDRKGRKLIPVDLAESWLAGFDAASDEEEDDEDEADNQENADEEEQDEDEEEEEETYKTDPPPEADEDDEEEDEDEEE